VVSKDDRIFLGVTALIGISFFFQTGSGKKLTAQPIDTKIYSTAVLILLFAGIVAVILELMAKNRRVPAQIRQATDAGGQSAEHSRLHNRLLFATFFIFLFYCFFFTRLGYFTTGFITLVAYMHVLFFAQNDRLTKKDSMQIFAIGIATTLVLYLIFGKLFALWLPSGLLI
jgi:hypothetical protein